MDWLILIFMTLILSENTFLLFKKHQQANPSIRKVYVDTSVLIDGRIINVARTGFIDDDLIILKSVLKELQLLADSKDNEKRNRARAGLSIVSELERIPEVNTVIVDDGDEKKQVDDELLKYAKENRGAVMTIDYNLIKVAEAENIPTLNMNDLALAVRTEFLPGEKITISITAKGVNRGQGVGHLPDGTLVIVENAANKVGQELEVELMRFHETSAGKMIFAKVIKSKTTKKK